MKRFSLMAAILAVAVLAISHSPVYVENPHAAYDGRVAVLMYHHISDTERASDIISPDFFEKQLVYLQGEGYHFISLSDFRSYMDGTGRLPPKAVLVTFDDGYQSFYTLAFPVLRRLGIPAVSFVITHDLKERMPGSLMHLGPGEIRTMRASSVAYDFQCHTNNLHALVSKHHDLLSTRVKVNGRPETDAQYRRRVLKDLGYCKQSLENLYPGTFDAFAYPYGITNPEVERLLRQSGFRYAFTIDQGMADRSANPLEIPRINAGAPYLTGPRLNTVIRLLN